MSQPSDPLRPRDYALLLLATGDAAPRRRARDQQADRIGMTLKQRVLERLVAADPEPDELPACLLEIVETLGKPFGPTHSIARLIADEWQIARTAPEWLAQLLDASTQADDRGAMRIGRQLPG